MVPPRRGWADRWQVGRPQPRALPHRHKLNMGPSESVESWERGTPGESLPPSPHWWFFSADLAAGKDGRGGREEKPPQVWAGRGQLGQDTLTQEAGAQVGKPCCPCPGLRSTAIVSEEGNRKETILDLEHKKSSRVGGETERNRGPRPREPGLPERLRMNQDTRGQCLLSQAQKCDKQRAGAPRRSGRGGDG